MEDFEVGCFFFVQCLVINFEIICVDGGCGGFNCGFLWDNVKLVIIWVSDEEDYSFSGLVEYVFFFKGLKFFG